MPASLDLCGITVSSCPNEPLMLLSSPSSSSSLLCLPVGLIFLKAVRAVHDRTWCMLWQRTIDNSLSLSPPDPCLCLYHHPIFVYIFLCMCMHMCIYSHTFIYILGSLFFSILYIYDSIYTCIYNCHLHGSNLQNYMCYQ